MSFVAPSGLGVSRREGVSTSPFTESLACRAGSRDPRVWLLPGALLAGLSGGTGGNEVLPPSSCLCAGGRPGVSPDQPLGQTTHTTSKKINITRPRPQVPPRSVFADLIAVSRTSPDHAERRDRAQPRRARLPAVRTARGGQDDARARAGDGAQLREQARGGEPCGECISCQRIWSGSSSLDVVEIDAASNRGVDDARELRERAMYAPSGDDRYKVYIVDEAHMLTREAWNALLKILEEPPPRVVFVFATTEPQKIAQAARRCSAGSSASTSSASVRPTFAERLAQVLAEEGVTAHPDALAMIARAADGSMRDALSLTDQVLSMGDGDVAPERVREALGLVPEDEFIALARSPRRAARRRRLRLRRPARRRGHRLRAVPHRLRRHGARAARRDARRSGLGNERARARRAPSRREPFPPGDLLRMLSALTELEPRFRKSGQQQLLLEALLVRFALLDRTVSLEAVLRGMGRRRRGPDDDPPNVSEPEASSSNGAPVKVPAREGGGRCVAATAIGPWAVGANGRGPLTVGSASRARV